METVATRHLVRSVQSNPQAYGRTEISVAQKLSWHSVFTPVADDLASLAAATSSHCMWRGRLSWCTSWHIVCFTVNMKGEDHTTDLIASPLTW